MTRPALLLLLACAALELRAQPAPVSGSAEPEVRAGMIEDEGAKIEELRVRGQTQRIVVSPKRGPRSSYEIITGDGSRDLSEGASSTRGAAGKRVWNVFSF
ncbi:MAG: hypothetical protein ABIO45_12895 [Burkholderiaceae bacterium]